MTADLADEHSTATLATERLEREEQERVRLERELQQAQDKNRGLQQVSILVFFNFSWKISTSVHDQSDRCAVVLLNLQTCKKHKFRSY